MRLLLNQAYLIRPLNSMQTGAQKFAVAIKGKPLRSRSPEDVYSFSADLETQKGFEALIKRKDFLQ